MQVVLQKDVFPSSHSDVQHVGRLNSDEEDNGEIVSAAITLDNVRGITKCITKDITKSKSITKSVGAPMAVGAPQGAPYHQLSFSWEVGCNLGTD